MTTSIDTKRSAPSTSPAAPTVPTPPPAQDAAAHAEDIGALHAAFNTAIDVSNAVFDTTLPGMMVNEGKRFVGGVVDTGQVFLLGAQSADALTQMKDGDRLDVRFQVRCAVGRDEEGAGALAETRASVEKKDEKLEVTTSMAAGAYFAAEEDERGLEGKALTRVTFVNEANTPKEAQSLLNTAKLAAAAPALGSLAPFGGALIGNKIAADNLAELATSAKSIQVDGVVTGEALAKLGAGRLFDVEDEVEAKIGGAAMLSARYEKDAGKLVFERTVSVDGGLEPQVGAKKTLFEATATTRVSCDVPPGFDPRNATDLEAMLKSAVNPSKPETTIMLGAAGVEGELTFKPATMAQAIAMTEGAPVPARVKVDGTLRRVSTTAAIAKLELGVGRVEAEMGRTQVLSTKSVDSVGAFTKAAASAMAPLALANMIGR